MLERGDDGKIRFCWINRDTNVTEESVVIDSNEFSFKKVNNVASNGRFYCLRSSLSPWISQITNNNDLNVRVFWMQEGSQDNDEVHCGQINSVLTSTSNFGNFHSFSLISNETYLLFLDLFWTHVNVVLLLSLQLFLQEHPKSKWFR